MLAPTVVYLIGTAILYKVFDDYSKVHFYSYSASFILCAIGIYYFRQLIQVNIGKPNLPRLFIYCILAIIYGVIIHIIEYVFFESAHSMPRFTLRWIDIIILAPLLEEIFFKGIAVEYLKKSGFSNWFIIIFTSLIFGLLHMPGIMQIHLFFMGAGLAMVYLKERNIVYPIVLHMIFNSIILVW